MGARLSGDKGEVIKELKRIEEQDDLDSLASEDEESLDLVEEVDSDWRKIRDDFNGWIRDMLQFNQIPFEAASKGGIVETPFRFQYKARESGRNTLISLADFINDFLPAIDFEAPGSNSRSPLTYPYVYRRQSANVSGVRVMRYGDSFIEAAKTFTDLDDRGRSWAMWRQVDTAIDVEQSGWYFRFDFLIEANLKSASALAALSKGSSEKSLSRRADTIFPPIFMRIWMDVEGRLVEEGFAETFLQPDYLKSGGEGYRDRNLSTTRWDLLDKSKPEILANWQRLCRSMREQALQHLSKNTAYVETKQEALRRAESRMEIRLAQMRTRVENSQGNARIGEKNQIAVEEKLHESLCSGIKDPWIRIDSVGAIFLSNSPFPGGASGSPYNGV
jgi:ATP-dependent helicase HepA